MNFHTEDNGVTIIKMPERFDSSMTENFKETIKSLCDQELINIVIDMSGVAYIDSSGLGAVVGALRRIREKNGDVKTACLHKQVQSVFQITRCYRLIEIYDDVQAAVSSFDTAREKG